MTDTTFIMFENDGIGRGSHLCEIKAHSARLMHKRRRRCSTAPRRSTYTAGPVTDVEQDAENVTQAQDWTTKAVIVRNPQYQPSPEKLGGGMVDPFVSTDLAVDHNFCRVLSVKAQSLFKNHLPAIRFSDSMMDGPLALAQRAHNRHLIFSWSLGARVTPLDEQQYNQEVIRTLSQPITGSAYLFCCMVVIAAILKNPDMDQTALHYKHQAIKRLRDKLATEGIPHDPQEHVRTVQSLFSAEIAGGNLQAAEIHGLALKQLIESDSSKRPLSSDFRVLHAVLWQETQRAVVSMTKVLLDLTRWTHMLGLPIADDPYDDPEEAKIPPMDLLSDSGLRALMVEIMWLTTRDPVRCMSRGRQYLSKLSARGLILQGQLLNKYIENTDRVSRLGKYQDVERQKLCTDSYMCLAMLYWLRRAMINEQASSLQFCHPWSARSTIVDRLQSLLTASKPAFGHDCPEAKGKLFAYYVGAVAEQVELKEDKVFLEISSLPFHNRKFVIQACLMGLATWESVKKVLKTFLYHEGIGTSARFWFEKIKVILSLS